MDRNGAEIAAGPAVGPTSEDRVRILGETKGVGIPMDFAPDEAEEIGYGLRAAGGRARATASRQTPTRAPRRRR